MKIPYPSFQVTKLGRGSGNRRFSDLLWRAQGEAGQAQEAQPQPEANGDTTQDVEFEEVK